MQPNASALGQQRSIFKKFMENLLAKSSKLRALVKELNKKYCDASESTMYEPQHEQKSLRSIMNRSIKLYPLPASKSSVIRHIQTLEKGVKDLETEHDKLNLQYAKGEVSGFDASRGPQLSVGCCFLHAFNCP